MGQPTEKNKDELTKELGNLNDLVISPQEPLTIVDSDKGLVQKTWQRLIEIFDVCFLGDEEEMVGMNQVTNLLFTLLHLMSQIQVDWQSA